MSHIIPDDKYYEIVESFRGTCTSEIYRTAETLHEEMFPGDTLDNGITIDQLNDELADRFMDDIQVCEVCEWWCEIDELEEFDDMAYVCTQCREEGT